MENLYKPHACVYSSDHGYIQHIAYLSEFNTYKINSGYIQI